MTYWKSPSPRVCRRFDYLLIESTGVSEPMPVAETFFFRNEAGFSGGYLAA